MTRRLHYLACLFSLSASLSGCWNDDDGAAPASAPAPAPAPASFTVGGGVSGLAAAGLVLANGSDTLTVASGATGFTLPTAVTQGAAYTVTVQSQPAGEHCSLTNSTGTINGANVTNVTVACAALSHSLGGTISGLPSAGLVLANGSDTVSPAAGALSFTFATPVAEGGAYAVSVRTQPTGATCSVGSGSGTMGTGNVATVQVTCAASAFTVGGAISGLTAAGLILANGTDTVSPAANATSYLFARTVAFGGSYSVTVQQQPPGLTCAVAGTFPATISSGNVTDIDVTCAAPSGLSVVVGQTSCPANAFMDGHGTAATVHAGEGMVFDASGNLYVIGGGAKVVRKITPAGDVTTLAGTPGAGGQADGTGAAASFGFPQGIAVDNAGNLYVGDSLAVRKVTQAGVVTTVAGNEQSQGFVDATGTAARFGTTKGVVTDSAGNLYIADSANNVIRKMTPAGVVTTFAGGGTPGGSAIGFVDAVGTAAMFSAPTYLAIDAAGNLYVGDTNNQAIRKITPAGAVSTLAGGGPTHPGFADGTGSAARFGDPQNLAMGPAGSVYVLDQGFDTIRLVSAAGVVTTLATDSPQSATGPISPLAFVMPPGQTPGIGADSHGMLYISSGCAVLKVGP